MKKILLGIALLFMAGNLMAQDDLFTFRYLDPSYPTVHQLKNGDMTFIILCIDRHSDNKYTGGQFDIVLPEGLSIYSDGGITKAGALAQTVKVGVGPLAKEHDCFQIGTNVVDESTVRVVIYPDLDYGDGKYFPLEGSIEDGACDLLYLVVVATSDNIRQDICPIYVKDAKLASSELSAEIPSSAMISYAVGDSGYGTLSVDAPLDFTNSELSAYTVSNFTSTFASLTKIDKVPAGTPVVIKGEPKEYILSQLVGDADAVTTNLLKGTPDAEFTADANTFALATKTPGTGFYRCKAGVVIPQYKAYLENATSTNEAFLFEETTGINKVETTNADTDVYTITGVKVNGAAQKGIYIQNGKKVVVK